MQKMISEMSDAAILAELVRAEELLERRYFSQREGLHYYDVREEARNRGLRPPAPPVTI